MSSIPKTTQPSNNFSPRAKKIVASSKMKPERDERDTEIDRLEIDNQTLKDILQKAKIDREAMVSRIAHLEQQLKIQDNVIADVQQQRDAEKNAFRKNIENSRSTLEAKYSKIQATVKERESLLLLWTEYATATLIENPSSNIRPLLVKTCNGVPSAKAMTGNIYQHYLDTVKAISTAAKGGDVTVNTASQLPPVHNAVPHMQPVDFKETSSNRNDASNLLANFEMQLERATNPDAVLEEKEGAIGEEVGAPVNPPPEGEQSRGMTACLKEINREVDSGLQHIDALLAADDAADIPVTQTSVILGDSDAPVSPRKANFLSEGPGGSTDDDSLVANPVDVEVQPKKTKKKLMKKKSGKGGKKSDVAKYEQKKRQGDPTVPQVDLSEASMNSSQMSSQPNSTNFWWQFSGTQSGSMAHSQALSAAKQKSSLSAAQEKSISFSDAEINRLLAELRMQQQPLPNQGEEATPNKFSMSLDPTE